MKIFLAKNAFLYAFTMAMQWAFKMVNYTKYFPKPPEPQKVDIDVDFSKIEKFCFWLKFASFYVHLRQPAWLVMLRRSQAAAAVRLTSTSYSSPSAVVSASVQQPRHGQDSALALGGGRKVITIFPMKVSCSFCIPSIRTFHKIKVMTFLFSPPIHLFGTMSIHSVDGYGYVFCNVWYARC